MNVGDVMMTNVELCHPGSSLEDVAMSMWNNDCGSIPIVDEENKLTGMITDRDIAMGAALKHKPLWEVTASEVTGSQPVFTCDADDDIHTAMDIMRANKIRRLPIVNEMGELKGILSIGDVIGVTEQGNGASLPFRDTMKTLKSVFTYH